MVDQELMAKEVHLVRGVNLDLQDNLVLEDKGAKLAYQALLDKLERMENKAEEVNLDKLDNLVKLV